jgi:response regulator RpfG family c-di-GMP phosphodiesterase
MVELMWRGNPEQRGYAARLISLDMGATTDEADNVGFAACLCNIGMVGIPDGLWNTPGPLSLDAHRDVQRHPEIARGCSSAGRSLIPR